MFDKVRRIVKIDINKLKHSDPSRIFWLDLTMLIITIINLNYLAFGWLFQFSFFHDFIFLVSSIFANWYEQNVFPNLFYYDYFFVAIFTIELVYRWIRSILMKKYASWWFYPLVHWYDVLICIPLINKGFDFFRLARLFALFYRLQRLGVFDITKTFFFKKGKRLMDIFIEEISDKVVANVLNMVQVEIKKGNPLMEKIVRDVVKPREDFLVNYLTNRISEAVNLSYTQYRIELKNYVEEIINKAVNENEEINNLKYLPVVGKVFQNMLDSAISDVTFNVLDSLMTDIADVKNERGVKEVTHAVIETFLDNNHPEMQNAQKMIVEMLNEAIELIKQQVLIKEWQKEKNLTK